jgi:uncharacterized protein (TIGR02453 family)
MTIQASTFTFLQNLRENNSREWFEPRKAEFQGHQDQMKAFFKEVNDALQKTDQIESHKVYRIYRDVRFSKDKTPYKSNFSGGFSRATAERRGGYFISLAPGNSFVGGGFYAPNKEDLKRLRQEFEMDDSEIRAVLNNPKFKKTFGKLQGAELKTAPRDFSPELKAIDLIRKKQFFVMKSFTDKEVLSPNFLKEVTETYTTIRPFFDLMSSILTTNLDGESVL